ncbi:isoamyl acetate-hydrolyzing esterase 1 homolog [Polypterus senegalus]|uniref:isoamyl acetate-hydrolyzing esterase 1 homolog n=1 Tax=Polypterus senegalus TaxID=55291 RepID=UPI0019638BAD|nr:isoamyl acetate-hydrolyzing esterase 1 homolog [Polypterus senegalus]
MSRVRSIVWPQVVLFGDSITQSSFDSNGWGAVIASKLVRKCDVINRGLSGYNSRWARIILPQIVNDSLNSKNVAAVTIFFGANDCALKDKNPQQHVPLEEYAENLKAMIEYLKTVDISKDRLILITPPPLDEAAWTKECTVKGCVLNRLNAVVGQYAQACVQVASECKVEVLDLWTLMQQNDQDFSTYLSDGLHLSAKGNEFVALHLFRLIEKRVAALPYILPYWADVDPLNPETTLLESVNQ